LVEKGHAYETGDGDVYFAVDSLPSYGALSGRKPEDNRAGGSDRVAVDAKKRNPADFALWKAAKPGEPTWASPWGEGRPGWHIECSAMIEKCLGPSIDIHGGGMDLTFPHHENELAQSTAACGCGARASADASSDASQPFVKYWVHNGFVKVDSEKMSKSLGNFFTIREVTERYHPMALRWMLLGTHYRAPINYTRRALEEASDRLFYAYQTLLDAKREFVTLTNEEAATSNGSSSDTSVQKKPKPPAGIAAEAMALAAETSESVANALADDLNTPAATASLSAPLKTLNDLVSTKKGRKAPGREQALGALTMAVSETLSRVGMPCDDEESGETCSIPILESLLEELKTLALRRAGLTDADVADAVARREAARAEKDFETSDAIRDELKRVGVALMDGAAGAGTDWRPCAVEAESE
jgi:cysteinyl-tRNA synthetase